METSRCYAIPTWQMEVLQKSGSPASGPQAPASWLDSSGSVAHTSSSYTRAVLMKSPAALPDRCRLPPSPWSFHNSFILGISQYRTRGDIKISRGVPYYPDLCSPPSLPLRAKAETQHCEALSTPVRAR
ncbi:unnamed protein product [Lota lota]